MITVYYIYFFKIKRKYGVIGLLLEVMVKNQIFYMYLIYKKVDLFGLLLLKTCHIYFLIINFNVLMPCITR